MRLIEIDLEGTYERPNEVVANAYQRSEAIEIWEDDFGNGFIKVRQKTKEEKEKIQKSQSKVLIIDKTGRRVWKKL